MTAPSFGASDVTVSLDGRNVLEGITLEVAPGEIVAAVGGDGAGKTTLLRTLVGAIGVASGSIERPSRDAIGYVGATPSGYGDLTVGENLAFVARVYRVPPAERAARVEELLRRTRLLDARDRLADELSGGMRRKLGLAMAVIHRPRLLVLDEPTTGVDPVGRAELWRLLTALLVEGTAIVFSTTYLDEAERTSRVLVLADGRPLLSGTPDELLARMPGVVGATDQKPSVGEPWRHGTGWYAWVASGQLPSGMVPVTPTLEDAVIVAQLMSEQTDRAAAAVAAAPAA